MVLTAGADPVHIEVLIDAGTPKRTCDCSKEGSLTGSASGGISAGIALGQAGQADPIHEVIVEMRQAVALQGTCVVDSVVDGSIAGETGGEGVAYVAGVFALIAGRVVLEVVFVASTRVRSHVCVQHSE